MAYNKRHIWCFLKKHLPIRSVACNDRRGRRGRNGDEKLHNTADPESEVRALRERLSLLSEASLRITEDLDLDTVLQEVADGARSITGAKRGGITILDEAGGLQAFVTSGLTAEERQLFTSLPAGMEFFHFMVKITDPIRVGDFSAFAASVGLPEIPRPAGLLQTFLASPIYHRGGSIGNFYLADKEGGLGFTQEDEDTLLMFAAHAAMAISNARRYRDEQRARADLETLVNTSPVGVAVFDTGTGVPVSLNREARRIVDSLRNPDQSPEDLLDVITFRRADGREVSLREFPLAQALSSGETVRAEEIVIKVPDGRSITTIINATPIPTEDGSVESMVVTLQDLSALEEQERLRAEFLSMVSHELRAPLTSIRGSADTLMDAQDNLDPAEMRQFHRIIREQADQMQGLITDLLDVARIGAGTLALYSEPSDVAALVERARTTFLSGSARHDIQIDLVADLPRVMADRRRIVQVLGNLLENAARHSPAGAAIRVGGRAAGVQVELSVSDDGVGISPERLPQLFRRFALPDGGDRASWAGGSGLGLAICKGIVEAHGGRIRAESSGVGLGARFTFTLLAVEEVEPVETALRARSAQSRGRRIRVLAVDDDPQTLRYVRDALTEAGYTAMVTGDPEAVDTLIREQKPHLVLLDLMLPGADGIELMESVPELSRLPVIFLSAYGRDQVIARALEAGADDYIVKPFSPTELVARIQVALRRRAPTERPEPSEPCVVGDLVVNFAGRRVTLGGRAVELTDIEYRVLAELAADAGRVVVHADLLRRVWGPVHADGTGPVRNIVKNLRRKLGDGAENPSYIFNEPRIGYRLGQPDESEC